VTVVVVPVPAGIPLAVQFTVKLGGPFGINLLPSLLAVQTAAFLPGTVMAALPGRL
jgi:hypothetical protein